MILLCCLDSATTIVRGAERAHEGSRRSALMGLDATTLDRTGEFGESQDAVNDKLMKTRLRTIRSEKKPETD